LAASTPPPPLNVNHMAFPTWDTEATRAFYCDVLGFRLVGAVQEDRVPSTGDETPFLHSFFAMESGECIAFFEVVDLPPAAPDGIPAWVRHFALNVRSMDELDSWQKHLTEHGVPYVGPVDHEGIWQSIYFFDPNGIRLEFTHQLRELDDAHAVEAAEMLARWTASKAG